MLNIFINDGGRHRTLSGYGNLSRNIILGLAKLKHRVYLQAVDSPWDMVGKGTIKELMNIPKTRTLAGIDLVLQIGSPLACRKFNKPSLMYTQNALGDLPNAWIESLMQVNGLIVPSQFDRDVFKRYFSNVFVAGQSSDPKIFYPDSSKRKTGSKNFTFLFVGSYSYRKGVDILVEAFTREFQNESVELIMQCANSKISMGFDHVSQWKQRVTTVKISLDNNLLTPEDMCKLYNQVDCVITLSRGEGWCMPITEALLCQKPVIAPNSTAMGEYLNENIAYLVPTQEKNISKITDPFGVGFAKAYGKPGNVCYEPIITEARRLMRDVVKDYDKAKKKAIEGQKIILNTYSWENAIKDIEASCYDFLNIKNSC